MSKDFGGKRVLIVDDSAAIRSMVSYLLGNAGYATEQAEDGEQALTRLITDHVDLMLLDINMPVMDGFETLRRLRQDSTLAATRVIVITTEEKEEDRKQAQQLGVVDYVIKPFAPSELLSLVAKYLGAAKS